MVAVRPSPTRRVHVAWRTSAAARPAILAAVAALQEAWQHYESDPPPVSGRPAFPQLFRAAVVGADPGSP